MSNFNIIATRQYGVCKGHLWKHSLSSGSSPTKSGTKKKEFVYCVLVGVSLSTFADYNAYMRGDHAMSIVVIVGASAWKDHSCAAAASETNNSAADTSFRMVTAQGTHIYCTCPTSVDRNVWLSSLHAGLEASLSSNGETTLPPFLPPSPKVRGTKRNYCKSCGKLAYQIVLEGAPLPQYGSEAQSLICPLCSLAQGVVLDVQRLVNLYRQQGYEKDALLKARQCCQSVVNTCTTDEDATTMLLSLIHSPAFSTYRRVCPTVEYQCVLLETCRTFPTDFIEALDASKELQELGELKKQAFRVAGDMGSAMKLLQSCDEHTDMLRYILEFFLDLCEEGELSSVAFFWPQLQCIHLRMLPPENASQLEQVELLEDFLLTVCTQYSVQLALELVWGYAADLEDSLYNTTCLPAIRQRRFSVLRFVCELESLLFDFEHGWGGGSVALKNMIQPSPHQVTLLRMNMLQLQQHRLQHKAHLTRSVRRDKLKNAKLELPPEQGAQEALRIARNADYFSSHLSFIRRLGDVTEKLRHLDLAVRGSTLERELTLLNSSGSMGGDPLNRISDKLTRVVRVPQKEGHVFRSKERTPVLLLMEVVEEGVQEDDMSPKKSSTSNEKKVSENGVSKGSVKVLSNTETDESHVAVDDGGDKIDSETKQAKGEGTGEAQSDRNATDDSFSEESLYAHERAESGDAQHDSDESKVNGSEAEEIAESTTNAKNKKLTISTKDKDIYSDPLTSLDEEFTDIHHHSTRALGKLKHFETPSEREMEPPMTTPTPSKEHVEELVETAMIEKLELPRMNQQADETEADEETSDKEDSDTGDEGKPRASLSRLNSALSGSKRMSAFGSDLGDTMSSLPGDEIRREVLTTIMMKGKRGLNAIASMSAMSAQKSLQDLDRKRAVDMILHGDEDESPRYVPPGSERRAEEAEAARQKLLEIGLDHAAIAETLEEDTGVAPLSEEDEAMESLRLLLLQNRVGQGTMSAESAAIAMAQPGGSSVINVSGRRSQDRTGKVDKSELIEIDAGDVDPRLSGCGALPPAVLSALTLWKAEVVSNGELLELVKKDLDYIRLIDEDSADKLIENSQFWGRFAYGERWAEKKARIAASSPDGNDPGWDLIGVIVKSNDDLRQEAFVMQLIELCDEAFQLAGLDLWLHPYRILATGRTTGIIEMVKNAMSFDALKKRPGYGRGGLREHLKRMTEFTADPAESFRCAQRNFVSSLAAYSLLSYFFLFKDRHNGNILLDTVGHVIHIDFGFVFGVAPGGSFSLEMSTPFKLTEEMMEVMGGMESPLFSEFVTLFCCGFLALQAHVDTFATVVEITCRGSSFKCFEGRDANEVVTKLRERFVPDFSKESTVAYALDLIKQATKSYGTKQYDYFQYLSQGIAA